MSESKKPKVYFGVGSSTPGLSIGLAVVGWLALDHWNAPGWAYGVAATVYALFVIAFIVYLVSDTKIITPQEIDDRLTRLEAFAKARTPMDDRAMWTDKR